MSNEKFELTLYFYPSPNGLDWSSPTAITWSVLANQFSKFNRKIGHVHVELRSNDTHLITGMAQATKIEEKKLLFWENIGLGILFHFFKGELEDHHDSHIEIQERAKVGNLSFLKILLSRESFERAHQYLSDYKNNGQGRFYGLANNPLNAEGGGCTAFAMSFLQVTGLMHDEFKKHWSRYIRVPEKLLGGKYHHREFFGHNSPKTAVNSDEVKYRRVRFLKLLFEPSTWAHPHEPHRDIFFWDAELMHAWVMGIHDGQITSSLTELKLEQLHNAKGIILDMTGGLQCEPKPWKK